MELNKILELLETGDYSVKEKCNGYMYFYEVDFRNNGNMRIFHSNKMLWWKEEYRISIFVPEQEKVIDKFIIKSDDKDFYRINRICNNLNSRVNDGYIKYF